MNRVTVDLLGVPDTPETSGVTKLWENSTAFARRVHTLAGEIQDRGRRDRLLAVEPTPTSLPGDVSQNGDPDGLQHL